VVGDEALENGVGGVGLPLLVEQAGVQQQPFGAVGQVGLAGERLQPAQGAPPLLTAFRVAQQRLQGWRVQHVQLLQRAQQVGGVGCLRVVAPLERAVQRVAQQGRLLRLRSPSIAHAAPCR
jgi:hypothetical protein